METIVQNTWTPEDKNLCKTLADSVVKAVMKTGTRDLISLIDDIVFSLKPNYFASFLKEVHKQPDTRAIVWSYFFGYLPRNAAAMDRAFKNVDERVTEIKKLASKLTKLMVNLFPDEKKKIEEKVKTTKDHIIKVYQGNENKGE